MKYNVAQIIGLNTDQKAALVTSSTQEDSSAFLAVLNLTCDDAFTKGRQFLSETSDFYLEAEGSPAEKLEATFKQATGRLKELTQSYDLGLGIVSGKILYLISQGQVGVYLKRGDKLSPLLALGSPEQLISGFLQDGDKVMFATESLISFLGEELNKTLGLNVETFEDEISSKVAAANLENRGLAGLMLELSDTEVAIPTLSETEPEIETAVQEIVNPKRLFNLFAPIVHVSKFLPKDLSILKRGFPQNGRIRLLLGVVLIIVVLTGIGVKYKSSQEEQKTLRYNQAFQKARDDFNIAQGLQGLNPAEAKNKLDSAKSRITEALNFKPGDKEAASFKKQIEDSTSSILQQFAASSFPLFLDLDLVKKNFRADQMSLSNGKILLLDPAVKTLISLDMEKKNNQILAGSQQLGEAQSASLNGGLAFVYSKDKGVLRIDVTNQKLVVVAKKDPDLEKVLDVYGFGGNIYLLDALNQMIWKYLPTSEGYSDKREYLSKNVKADFIGSLRMQIESSIYVLKKGGEILRFTKGDKDNFSLEGLDKGVKDPKSFFVSSDTEDLYLLDSGNSRLVVLSKTGQFKSQYQGDKFATASDLVVDEAGKKVYLLEGSKIYSTDLK